MREATLIPITDRHISYSFVVSLSFRVDKLDKAEMKLCDPNIRQRMNLTALDR